ncbi:UbiA family prenyltransferase [Parapedobacter koreensis]|uniref:UbiA prenyltransferase family protein n=1 Tax=Parapedobacter koreensis TaxID=332977 RepID=A0A1H7RR22_9SPHI|nr:UbiA family prenyltransferase [Parapedobacter koreensis]SEL62625.1 UbiA prenyltransferase family protein [Parapedobacter koreensis]
MMRNYAIKVLELLLFSNVFIACCAVAQGGLSYLLLSLPMNYPVLAILGCATLAMYNFSMILAKPQYPEASPYRRVRWIFRHEHSLWMWTGVALMVSFVLGLQLHLPSFALLGAVGAMGLAYNVPLIRIKGARRWVGLRQLTGLKLFYIGAVWAMSCVLLPVAEAYHDGLPIPWPQAGQLTAWVFLFVVAITIPFDIRDLYQDRYYGLKTIPVLVGERKALALSVTLLVSHAGWVWVSDHAWNVRIALSAVSLLCLLVISFPPLKKNEYYYFLLLDGMMIVQFLAVWTVS